MFASYTCDYYITKYSCTALEQLAFLVTPYALGIRRLEDDEQKEAVEAATVAQDAAPVNVASLAEEQKRRARRVTIQASDGRQPQHLGLRDRICDLHLDWRDALRVAQRYSFDY